MTFTQSLQNSIKDLNTYSEKDLQQIALYTHIQFSWS